MILLILLFPFHGYEKIALIIQYNQLMICFNILPIFPLDGYRIVFDLVEKNTHIQLLCIYIGILLLVPFFLMGFFFRYYGWCILAATLGMMNYRKIKSLQKQQMIEHYVMMYELSSFGHHIKKEP